MNTAVAEKKPRLTTSAMIASIASEGQRVIAAPFHRLERGLSDRVRRERRDWLHDFHRVEVVHLDCDVSSGLDIGHHFFADLSPFEVEEERGG